MNQDSKGESMMTEVRMKKEIARIITEFTKETGIDVKRLIVSIEYSSEKGYHKVIDYR